MNIDTRSQIIEAFRKNSSTNAVAREVGNVSHVSVWQIARDEHIGVVAGKAKRGKPGISPRMRARIIEALGGSNASPRLLARQLDDVSNCPEDIQRT